MFASIYYVDIYLQPIGGPECIASCIDYFLFRHRCLLLCGQIMHAERMFLEDLHTWGTCLWGLCVMIDGVLLCEAQSTT